ncbi:coiled-coil domain-containing protein 175 isoform X1 [Hypanus sabinus]|uniref:coiled-coil domain-containing protein 175 isoform X1 n=2 Tax=Hypanus sabinus TaxID=79690 RepID=UPI0028C38511|nr:coiled-coil domain-containing protein 175 isoform X1 [Hypanus sabinus]XP_059812992.1 coiled-coil domain-containing protein 175 isoform X1 [Hypanus sabinus]
MEPGVQPCTVKLALKRLQELEKQLKVKGICSEHGTVQHFGKIVEGVHELEKARKTIHEILEVETIEASKLRYTLSMLPNKLKQQIAAAVASARESKVTHLNEMKAKIEMMTQQIEALEKEYCRLEQENASLCPIHQEAGARYNDIIFLMNNMLGDRANKQITLNETYANIQDLKQKIVDVTRDIADLKKKMDEKRNEFKTRKESLMAKFTEVQQLRQEQNKINFEKKNKLDDLKMKLDKLNENILLQEKKTATLRAENTGLIKQEMSIQREHNEKLKTIEDLIKKKEKITDELSTLIEYYKTEIEKLRTRSLQAQQDIDKVQDLNRKLTVRRESRSEAAKKAKEHETEKLKRLQNLTDRLYSLKELIHQTEENLSSMRREIQELEEMRLNLAEQHKDTMEFLRKELEKYSHKLEKEKELREATIHKKEEMSRELLATKRTAGEYLTTQAKRLQNFMKERDKLIEESMNLQKRINEYAEKIKTLKQQFTAEEDAFRNMEQLLSVEINHLKDEIKETMEKVMQVKKELEVKLPIQQQLETELAEQAAICDELQKELIDLISKKSSLDSTISRLKRETGILLVSKPDLQSLLTSIRNNIFHQVKNTAEQLKMIGVDIYEADRRLELTEIENCKLWLCNFQLTKDVASLKGGGEKQKAKKEIQDNELLTIYDNLMKNWALDFNVQKEFATCNQSVLNGIDKLMNKIQLREMKLGNIGEQLKEHLSRLQSFVGSTPSLGAKEVCMIKQTILHQ